MIFAAVVPVSGKTIFIFACLRYRSRCCFALNAALVTSQWQPFSRTVSMHPVINAEHEVTQDSRTVFEVLDTTRPGNEPSLQTFCGAFSTNCPTSPMIFKTWYGICLFSRARV